jgi:crossover junction endodeoxyribonuclease RuvC
MTILLGIDPGTRITGYGLIKLNGSLIEPIDFGCIRPPANLPLAERYRIIFEALEIILERHKPHSVAVESQFVMKNVQSAIKLGMAKGMVLLAAARKKIEVHEYAPKQAKLAVVGSGGASKTQVQRMIAALLRLPKNVDVEENAADALALAICHAHNLRRLECLNTSKVPLSIKSR